MPVEVVGISDELWATVHNAADMARLALYLGTTAMAFVLVLLTIIAVASAWRRKS